MDARLRTIRILFYVAVIMVVVGVGVCIACIQHGATVEAMLSATGALAAIFSVKGFNEVLKQL